MRTYHVEYLLFKLFFRGLKILGLPSMRWYYKFYHSAKQRKIKQMIPESLELLKANDTIKDISYDAPIFFMWWQGLDKMPDVVKLCYSQLKKCTGSHPVIFLCESNFRDIYYDLTHHEIDKKILDWYYDSQINVQHLSDILRNKLLYHSGGIWVDATVFLTTNVNELIKGLKFFSGKRPPKKSNYNFPANGRWTSYFIITGVEGLLTKFLYSGLEEIVEHQGRMPDYFTLDYLFSIADQENYDIKTMIDSIPTIEPIIGRLNNVGHCITRNEFDDIIGRAPLFKLDWRKSKGDYNELGQSTILYYLKDYSKNYE